jgi:hypothetical protein
MEIVWFWDEVHVDRTKESLSLDVRIFAMEIDDLALTKMIDCNR